MTAGRHEHTATLLPDGKLEFANPFYWTTWVLIWCLPPLILVRGVRQKDRFVIAVGAISIVLTFVTNKPYLGWQRHTWDPMLLGIALTAVADGQRQTHHDRRLIPLRPAITSVHYAGPAAAQFGVSVWWRRIRRRWRQRRFLSAAGTFGS
jgi:hypothetical protein